MSIVYVCDICKEPVNPEKEVYLNIRSEVKSGDYHAHKNCLDEKIPGLWVLK